MHRFRSPRTLVTRLRDARVTRFVPAVIYPAVLLSATGVTDAQPTARRAAWLSWASTDLANLTAHPVGSLLTSAFVTPHYALVWAGLSVLGLACLGARLGGVRTVTLTAAAHVLATLTSQGVVAARIAAGDLADDARTMLDVGPSYVVVAALVAAIGFGLPRAGRLACAAAVGLLAPALLDGVTEFDVTALGHSAATVLALVGAAALLRWWPPGATPRSGGQPRVE